MSVTYYSVYLKHNNAKVGRASSIENLVELCMDLQSEDGYQFDELQIVEEDKMNSLIELGSIVKLKSGGPWMTINIVSEKGYYAQYYFEGEYRQAYFVKEAVELKE